MMVSRVAVLMGGWSAEREVSLVSGKAVADTLADCGYSVKAIDVQPDLESLLHALTPLPDVVFNALHGRGGEDGVIQGVLDMLGVPYTHSSLRASAIAMDKPITKRLMTEAGLKCPSDRMATREQVLAGHVLPPPYVVKPAAEGSSVGVTIVHPGYERSTLTPETWNHGNTVMVEEYIPGRELTVAVMSAPGEPARAMAVTEIRPTEGFYDYRAKYTEGRTSHIIPADLPQALYRAAMAQAVTAHQALGCTGVSRTDFRYDDRFDTEEGLYFLELNTQPGMTPLSLVPEQAQYIGISFRDLVIWMVENATCHA